MPYKLQFYNVKSSERKKRMKHCKTNKNVEQVGLEDSKCMALQNYEQSVTEYSEQLVVKQSGQ